MPNALRSCRSRAAGFTLIELLIALTVIGILVAISIPGLLNALDRAKQTASASLLHGFGTALEAYGVDNHGYPLATDVRTLIPLLQPYTDTLRPRDEWHHDIGYTTSGTSYSLECYGKDGIDGADITPATRNIYTLDIIFCDGSFTAGIQ